MHLMDVLELVSHMQRQGVILDNYSFPCIPKAYGVLEAVDYGQEIHCLIVRSGLLSDVFTGNALLAMYAKCGRTADTCKVFDKMFMRAKRFMIVM